VACLRSQGAIRRLLERAARQILAQADQRHRRPRQQQPDRVIEGMIEQPQRPSPEVPCHLPWDCPQAVARPASAHPRVLELKLSIRPVQSLMEQGHVSTDGTHSELVCQRGACSPEDGPTQCVLPDRWGVHCHSGYKPRHPAGDSGYQLDPLRQLKPGF